MASRAAYRASAPFAAACAGALLAACGVRTELLTPLPIEDAADAPEDADALDTSLPDSGADADAIVDSGVDAFDSTLPDTAFDVPPEADTSLPDVPLGTLAIAPPDLVRVIDLGASPVVPVAMDYGATLQPSGVDVTAATTFVVADPAVGGFTGRTFRSVSLLPSTLVRTTVSGALKTGESGSTSLTLAQYRKTPDPTGRYDYAYVSPYKGTPAPGGDDVLAFSANVGRIDVAFLMDTTGSMKGELANLQSNLTSTIIPSLSSGIASLGLAVAGHDDYPYPAGGYGSPGDLPVYVRQTVTLDAALATNAVNGLTIHYGNDAPEAQIPAMQHLLTGEALAWPGGSVPAHLPPAGATWFGGAEFRAGAVPIIVEITDASWHDAAHYPYTFPAPTLDTLTAAYLKAGAKFVGVLIDLGTGDSPVPQANQLSDATGSSVPPAAFLGKCGTGMCCTGLDGAAVAPDAPGGNCRLNFAARSTGVGVSGSIVTAIEAVETSGAAVYDARVVAVNDPSNPPGVDATRFISEVRALSAGDAAHGCSANPAIKSSPGLADLDEFTGVPSGRKICWQIVPAVNDFVPALDHDQIFAVRLRVSREPGDVFFGDERVVLFVVPKK